MKDLSFKRSLFFFLLILLILELIIYKDFIFGDYQFIYKDLGDDTYVISYPNLFGKIESLKLGEIPSYSFSNGLGENQYPFWLEPIALLITFVFFKNDVASSMIWIQLTYSTLAGIFFFAFLRGFKFHYFPATLFSLLYVFSGFMLVHSTWMHLDFSNSVMMFAFFLFAWQRFIVNRKWFYFPLATALLAISCTPVNLYFAILLIGMLMLLQAYSYYDGKWKTWFFDVGKLIGLGLLGIGISCFTLLSNLKLMANSPRGSGNFTNNNLIDFPSVFQLAETNEIRTSFYRLFSPNLEGITDGFTGWANYFEAPIWYCGLIILLLIPQLFHFLNKREKLVYGIVLFIFLILALFPYFRIFIWFYSGNYYRSISLLFCVISLFMSGLALDNIIRKNLLYPKTLIATMVILMLLFVSQKDHIIEDTSPSYYAIIFMLLCYAGTLFYWNKWRKPDLKILFVLVILEIILFAGPTIGDRVILTDNDEKVGVGYYDATVDAVVDLKKKDKGFFRIEKDYFSGISRDATFNEAKIQNFFGSRTYNSFSNVHYIDFLICVGELEEPNEASTRWVNGISGSTNVMRLCGVKFFLTKRDSLEIFKSEFDLIGQNRDVKMLQLKNSLPLGYTYDKYIDVEDFQKMQKVAKQAILLDAVVLDKAILPRIDYMKSYNKESKTNLVERDTLSKVAFSNNSIVGEINSKKSQLLFFSIPFDEGWSLKLDGEIKKIEQVFGGLMGVFITQGRHTVDLEFNDKYKSIGTQISLVTLLIYIALLFQKQLKTIIKFSKSTNK